MIISLDTIRRCPLVLHHHLGGLQLQLDDEGELLRAALRHLEAQLLEAAHLGRQAGR